MRTIIPILLLLLTLTGCRTKYVPVQVHTTDSVIVHDTLIHTELIPYRDSVVVAGTPTARSYLFNPYCFSWAMWDGTMLHHSLSVWPGKVLTIRVPYFIDRVRRIEVPVIQEVPIPLTRWQQFKLDVGGIAIGIAIAMLAIFIWRIIITRRQ